MKKEEISSLAIMDRMVRNDNKGIQMSNTIYRVQRVPQGSVIGFGVENHIGDDANTQMLGLTGEYLIFCMAVKKSELEETRKLINSEPVAFNKLSDIDTIGNCANCGVEYHIHKTAVVERFQMPNDEQLIQIAILINNGKLQKRKLADMVAMCEFILDRLYENGNVTERSSKED